MNKKQSLISYLLCLIFVFCSLLLLPVQSQSSQIDITLTWSTNTYVPLDYPGKALPTRGSIIEMVANINPQEVNSQELNYRWFLNEHLQREQSGQGKSVLKFPVSWSAGNQQSVRTEVRDEEENLLASAYLDIKIIQPEIILRPTIKTTQGIKKEILPLNSSIFSVIKKYQVAAEQEISFVAQPYFFNIKDIDELDYQWSLGGEKAIPETSTNPNILLLEIGQLSKSIKRDLNISVENKRNSLEKVETFAEINIIP